jgi:formamidopyrimidine-DNA glycosylase
VLVLRLGSQSTISRETASMEPGPQTQLVAVFTTGGAIHYTDPEKSGELFVVPVQDVSSLPELRTEGIDPLADTFTWHSIQRELAFRKQPLKTLLTDESFIIGLGDLYSDEVLWTAGLAGLRPSESLSSQEVRRLYRALLEVLYEAVKQGGTGEDLDDFEEGEEHGDFGDYIKVYGREHLPCARCRQPIVRERIKRGVDHYWCPQCQT